MTTLTRHTFVIESSPSDAYVTHDGDDNDEHQDKSQNPTHCVQDHCVLTEVLHSDGACFTGSVCIMCRVQMQCNISKPMGV